MQGGSLDQHETGLARGESEPHADPIVAGDLVSRVASVVGEIEALKRERHAKEVLPTRLAFASVYFRKRRRSRAEAETAPIGM